MKIYMVFFFIISALMSIEVQASNKIKTVKPNILFIAIDDLRPMLASYGDELAKTPNLDMIAAQGLQFNHAYAQQAICGPSRASLLTGLRPDTTGVTHNYIKFRDNIKDIVTLPQHFINNGYIATNIGKVFHHGDKDKDNSWNWQPAVSKLPKKLLRPGNYALKESLEIENKNSQTMYKKYGEQAKFGLGRGPAFEAADVDDNKYLDGYNTDLAIVTLKDLLERKMEKPIFFGFGMNKPHLPWVAPKKYWDLYDPNDIKLSNNMSAPVGGASMGLHASFEMRTFNNIPNSGEISSELAVQLKHAYLANVSFVDAQIGRIISEFKKQNIFDNTIVVVWSDHGYHLGDMGIWGKATNYEIATRVPFLISTPQMRRNNKALETDALVELVDIYPTISELAGLKVREQLEGQSLVPLLSNPKNPWKKAAFSQFPSPALREWGAYPLRPGMRETYFGSLIKEVESRIKLQVGKLWQRELFEQYLMGYSMRTKRYRMIIWLDTRNMKGPPLFIELYDHINDGEEKVNIAKQSPETIKVLLKQFYEGWKGARAKDI